MEPKSFHHALSAFKAGYLTLFSILVMSLMGPVFFSPTTVYFLDALIYLSVLIVLAVGYFRVAHAYYARTEQLTRLESLQEIAYELMGLFGGGFFSVLCGWIAIKDWREQGALVGNNRYVAGATVIFLGAIIYSLTRFVHYLRERPAKAGP
jgi:hypothetical protein